MNSKSIINLTDERFTATDDLVSLFSFFGVWFRFFNIDPGVWVQRGGYEIRKKKHAD